MSEGTLRAWTDAGEVPSHRTPGGHRRFLESDLAALLLTSSTRPGAVDSLAGRAVSRIRRRMDATTHADTDWTGLFSEVERARFREQGRRLVELASAYLTKPKQRPRLGREAYAIGEEYGHIMAGHYLTLSRAVDTFVLFRNLVEEAAAGMYRSGQVSPGQQQELHRHVLAVLDQVMRGIVYAYETHQQVAD